MHGSCINFYLDQFLPPATRFNECTLIPELITLLLIRRSKMFKPRPCGCKGIRTCLICEADFGIEKVNSEPDNESLKVCDQKKYCLVLTHNWNFV